MIDQKPFIRAGVPTNQHPNISTTNYSQPPPPPPPPPPSTTDLNHHLRCPRCDSSNTKFCYYNNYNLTQPRYFCKTCRRYWTRGGALRNVPIGGGCRKNKGATIAAALAKQISSATGKLTDIQKSNFINNLQRSKPILWPNYSPQTSHLLSLLNPNPNPNPSFASLNENLFNPIWRNCEMVRDQRHENGTHEVKIKGENAGELMHQELRSFPLNYNYDHGDDQVVAEPVTNGSVSTTSVANGDQSGFWNLMIPWSDLSITNSTAYP